MKLTFSTAPEKNAVTVRFFSKADRTKVPPAVTEAEFSVRPGALTVVA